MRLEMIVLFFLLFVAAAWACARADNWAERFVQLVALAMAGLGVFAVAGLVYLQLVGPDATLPLQPRTTPSPLGQSWLSVLSLLGAALGGGLGGAVFSYRVYLLPKERASTTLALLEEAMRVQALEEAWIVEAIGEDNKPDGELARTGVLTRTAPLPEGKPTGAHGHYLCKVEVRAVLDEPQWCCSEDDPFYGILGPRRAWIVRERVQGDGSGRDHRPALLSSRAIEELVAWMEKVSTARKGKLLTDDGANSLRTALLSRVLKDDILSYVSEKPPRLSSDARRTLHELGKKLGNKSQASQGRPSN